MAEYATPGTPDLAEALGLLIPKHEVILMANHGVVTYGEDVLHAYMKMDLVEHFARIALVTKLLGQQQLLATYVAGPPVTVVNASSSTPTLPGVG